MLALPGSAYLYQGEELGLHEVADLPADVRCRTRSFCRTGASKKGRDGCRVPLPWTADGPSFGFGAGGAHLPQPAWFGALRRRRRRTATTTPPWSCTGTALELRRELQADEELEWVPGPASVLHFVRPGGWHCITNFGARAVRLPAGRHPAQQRAPERWAAAAQRDRVGRRRQGCASVGMGGTRPSCR